LASFILLHSEYVVDTPFYVAVSQYHVSHLIYILGSKVPWIKIKKRLGY